MAARYAIGGVADGLRLEAALSGRLEQADSAIRESFLQANRDSLETVGRRGLERLRTSLREAGLEEIDTSWRLDLFPARGLAYEPVALLYSKADAIVQGHDEGGTIHPRTGRWLWIPAPGARDLIPRRRGPKSKLKWAFDTFGAENLKFIPPRGGRGPLLILTSGRVTPTGRLRAAKKTKAGRFGKDAASFVLFIGVKQVRLAKRLDVRADFAAIADDWAESYEPLLRANLQRNFAALGEPED